MLLSSLTFTAADSAAPFRITDDAYNAGPLTQKELERKVTGQLLLRGRGSAQDVANFEELFEGHADINFQAHDRPCCLSLQVLDGKAAYY